MSIRLPLKTVGTQTYTNETGTSSAAGGISVPVTLLQDTDNVVVKLKASTVGGGVSAVFQTTDDGGTTYYDVARTSIVSNTAGNTLAQWINLPVIGHGFRSAVQGQNSVAGSTNVGVILQTTGSAAASTLGQYQQSGLPILSQQGRVFLILTGDHIAATGSSITVEVKVNSQSATA